jgi:hypothetical protein
MACPSTTVSYNALVRFLLLALLAAQAWANDPMPSCRQCVVDARPTAEFRL